MATTPRFLSDLAGTLLAGFRIGVNKLVAASGVITARNAADNADVELAASGFRAKGATYKTTVKAASSGQSADIAIELPAALGSNGQALVDDGTGTGKLVWATVSTGANAVKAEDQVIAFGSTSPVSIVALPAGSTVSKIVVDVETAFDGAPSLSVGLVGSTSKYMGTTDMDLAQVASFEVQPSIEEAGAVTPIVTYAAGGASVGSARVTVHWVLPG